MADITCSRCANTRAGFERAPFPGTIGERVQREICTVCWGEWNRQQMMLINHYGLNLMDSQARQFLRSEEHTSELQSQSNLVCRLLLEKKKKKKKKYQM